MPKKPSVKFSKHFLWGAATSAHQIEGNTNNQWTVWEKEHAKTRAAQAVYHYGDLASWPDIEQLATLPANYISGKAVDHYTLYEQDFDLLEQLHLNAFRFSIEWSRVEPEEGAWNVEAIAHYKAYIAQLKKRGIEPVMTLFHYTLPIWFDEKGGFEKRTNNKYFVRFAEKIMEELGAHVKYVITINEPGVYVIESYRTGEWPPGVQSNWTALRVFNNLAHAHNQVAKALHASHSRVKVSVAYNSSYIYAGDDAVLSQAVAGVMQYASDDYFLKKVAKQCDFIGLNYYFSDRVYGYRVHNPDVTLNDMGWDVAPENIEHAIVRLHDKYKLPILVTENGIADLHDAQRQVWITKTITAMANAQEQGANIIGYLHWSLTDNFEWAHGRWPRFGLAEVNYTTYERTLRPSGAWFGKVVKHLRESDK